MTPFIKGPFISPGASLEAQLVKHLPAMQETWVQSLGWEDPLKKGTATHSSILVWRIPWTIVYGVAVIHNWATFSFISPEPTSPREATVSLSSNHLWTVEGLHLSCQKPELGGSLEPGRSTCGGKYLWLPAQRLPPLYCFIGALSRRPTHFPSFDEEKYINTVVHWTLDIDNTQCLLGSVA